MFLPLLFLGAKLLAAAVVVTAAVVIISFRDLMHRLRSHKMHDKDTGRLIIQYLERGEVRIVGSVLSPRPLGIFPRRLRHQETFVGKPDAEMKALLRGRRKVRINL